MKLPLFAAAAALVLSFSTISRADLVIVQSVESGMQSMPTSQMTVKIKGDKTRADISAQMSSITDTASGDSVVIMHPQKSYMKMSAARTKALMEQMQKLQEQAGAAKADEAAPAVTAPKATGKKAKIGQWDTEEYTCQVGNMSMQYWVARNFPNWAKIQQQMLKNQEKNLSQMLKGKTVSMKDLPGMPVKTVVDFNGTKISTTIVSVTEQELSAADFEIPAGYTEMAMPAFPGAGGAGAH
jgi:hypothetical protein